MEVMKHEDRSNPLICGWLGSPLTLKELRNALKSAKKRSAPSLDQIDFSMIASLPAEFLTHVLDIYK